MARLHVQVFTRYCSVCQARSGRRIRQCHVPVALRHGTDVTAPMRPACYDGDFPTQFSTCTVSKHPHQGCGNTETSSFIHKTSKASVSLNRLVHFVLLPRIGNPQESSRRFYVLHRSRPAGGSSARGEVRGVAAGDRVFGYCW